MITTKENQSNSFLKFIITGTTDTISMWTRYQTLLLTTTVSGNNGKTVSMNETCDQIKGMSILMILKGITSNEEDDIPSKY